MRSNGLGSCGSSNKGVAGSSWPKETCTRPKVGGGGGNSFNCSGMPPMKSGIFARFSNSAMPGSRMGSYDSGSRSAVGSTRVSPVPRFDVHDSADTSSTAACGSACSPISRSSNSGSVSSPAISGGAKIGCASASTGTSAVSGITFSTSSKISMEENESSPSVAVTTSGSSAYSSEGMNSAIGSTDSSRMGASIASPENSSTCRPKKVSLRPMSSADIDSAEVN